MEKLLALATLGQKVYARWLFLRLLSGIVVVAGLTIVASILMGALLVGGFFAAYQALLHFGFEPLGAAGIVGGCILFVLIIFVFLAVRSVRQLQELPQRLLKKKSPLVARTDDIVDAFFEGLLGRSEHN